jgi:hypothetical protein
MHPSASFRRQIQGTQRQQARPLIVTHGALTPWLAPNQLVFNLMIVR